MAAFDWDATRTAAVVVAEGQLGAAVRSGLGGVESAAGAAAAGASGHQRTAPRWRPSRPELPPGASGTPL